MGYRREVPRERILMFRKGVLGLGKSQEVVLVVVVVGIQEGVKKRCLEMTH